MISDVIGKVAIAVLFTIFAEATLAIDTPADIREVKMAPLVRGGMVFQEYCVVCHGQKGDGKSAATRLYKDLDLAIKPGTAEYYEKMVAKGSAALGKSPFMPPYGEEIEEEDLADLMVYLAVIRDPIKRGEVVFKVNCILCHGVKADGQGRTSQLYEPRPSDLRRSDKNRDYMLQIVKHGGEAMGRSPVMPQWGLQISEAEIEDVVDYVQHLVAETAAANPKK
ncbi:MAG: c-type cytochrome [Pseudomonadota bacterium]